MYYTNKKPIKKDGFKPDLDGLSSAVMDKVPQRVSKNLKGTKLIY